MDKIDVSEDFFSGVRYVYASRENGKMTLLPNDNASELLLDIKNAFSVDTTVRKAACDLSNIVLTRLNEKFGENHLDFCAIFGFIDDPSTKLSVLRLKGTAAGLHPNGMLKWESINVGEGFIGQAALNKMPLLTNDLRNDPRASTPIEKSLAQLADKLALLAYPLILASGELAGVLVVGKFHAGELSEKFFKNPDLNRIINWLVPHIATTLDNAKWVSKAQLQKKYLEHERRIGAIIRQFYNEAIAERNLKKLMEAICSECMNILNSGKPEQPFYQNFLFYEYQKYRERFVLRSYIHRPKSVVKSFHLQSRHYREYMRDRQVKCLESQAKFVQTQGKSPYVVRYLFKNKLEEIIPRLGADRSPAAHGTAFILPLFDNDEPLGVILFWSRRQNRQYVNKRHFYLGPERRTVGRNDLRFFRSLQPLIASEYSKFKAEEERQRRISDLESILSATKEIILLEDQSEVLNRLAKFTAQSLNCEGCIIYLTNHNKAQLGLAAAFGFQVDETVKRDLAFPLQSSSDLSKAPPVQCFKNPKTIILNGSAEFRRFCGNQKKFAHFFGHLKSNRVISYLGQSIGDHGVIEAFNKSKQTASAWSFFEEQDSNTVRHIADAIVTVLKRIEATASQVRSEKMKVTGELLLDISHELKNPLYSSSIFLRKLKASLSDHINSEDKNGILQVVDLVERNVDKAQRILASMQHFQASATLVKRELVNLEKIIRIVLQTNVLFCDQQHITLGSKFLAREPLVQGDELQLNQVFTNLVKNAIDAMPKGGMLQVQLDELDGSLVAEITDTGDGIPEEVREHVFDPFVTTKSPGSGTGLGLALSLRMIKQHRGTIEFETKLGWGTKFIVTLPHYAAPTFTTAKLIADSQSATGEKIEDFHTGIV